jgi:protein-tyrosine phosphatase
MGVLLLIDLHCHILPGIDDGADTWEESMEMARISVAGGVKTAIATPHFSRDLSPDFVKNLVKEFNERLSDANISLTVMPGMEIYLDPEIPNLLKTGHLQTIGDKYLLIELPMNHLPLYTDEVLFRIMVMGYTVILAHPERNRQVIENPGLVFGWLQQGMLVQINSGSLLGNFGSEVRKTCETLLKANLVHFMGSDAHSSVRRKPELDKAEKVLKQIVPNPRQISELNGLLILLGGFSPHENFKPPVPNKQAWWKKLLG